MDCTEKCKNEIDEAFTLWLAGCMWYFRVVRKSQARASGADLGIVNIIIIIIIVIIIISG